MTATLAQLCATASELAEDGTLYDPTDETIILAVLDFHPSTRDLSWGEVKRIVAAYDRSDDPTAPLRSTESIVGARCF